MSDFRHLSRRENQALGIGRYAVEFLQQGAGEPAEAVFAKIEQFHTDSVACGVAALGCDAAAPRILREEALGYACRSGHGANCFGSLELVPVEKAVVANCSAVRELDANGTNFGHNPRTGANRGEFGHNDFYPVAVAAAQQAGWDGRQLARAMICLDEIRGRLAEVFALKDYKIDHVLHGAIASAAVYGAALGATPEQIESAIGLTVAHYVPFRAIRAGHQLSDSKGASAAISAEMAVLSMQRALRGFRGPADVFRNPQALFCLFEPPDEPHTSPFDLELAMSGSDFAILGMHFKLGLYEHQSAGAVQGLIDVLSANPQALSDVDQIQRVRIAIYEPAFSIIGDPAKRDPRTRQSADHSMVYIVATLLRKACERRDSSWQALMLLPEDYNDESLFHPVTRRLMQRIEFVWGGPEYDRRYPDGIPTTLEIEHGTAGTLSSGWMMYPLGHARCTRPDLETLLRLKFQRLAALGVPDPDALWVQLQGLTRKSAAEIRTLYQFPLSPPTDGSSGLRPCSAS